MKRLLFVGFAVALAVMLMPSCNKNRFDLNHVETVEAHGEWLLPVGNARITLGQILEQLGDNEMISTFVSHDSDNNIRIRYKTPSQRLLSGTMIQNMISYQKVKTTFRIKDIPPGLTIEPISGVYKDTVEIPLYADSAGVELIKIKEGGLFLSVTSPNLGVVDQIVITSPNIVDANGNMLVCDFNSFNENTVDMTGATFNMRNPETGELEKMKLVIEIHFTLSGELESEYEVRFEAGFKNLKIQEVRGFVNSFVLDLDLAESFQLPLENIGGDGQLDLRDVKLQLQERSTFENLQVTLQVDEAELFGGGQEPFNLFDGPREFRVIPSTTFVDVVNETMDLHLNVKYDSVRVSSKVIFDSYVPNQPIIISENSFLDFMVDAIVPLKFNASKVTYSDTIESPLKDLPESLKLDMLTDLNLSLLVGSELPFNISADLYAYDSNEGRVVDTLAKDLHINGSFDGTPTETSFVVNLVKELTDARLNNLKKADKVLMSLGIDTDGHEAVLNLDNAVSVTIKADASYDEINVNFNNFF